MKHAVGSNIVDSVALVGKGDSFDAEVGVHNKVSTEHLSRHDLSLFCIDDLLPRVSCVRHHKAKVKSKFFDHLPMHAHHLLDGEFVHDFLGVEYNLAPYSLAS